MQISRVTAGLTGAAASDFPGGLRAAAAALASPPATGAGLDRQLEAFGALAGRWRTAAEAEKPALAEALTASPFAQGVQSTLNAFTRAAWAGADAAPPAPQARVLEAFDALSGDDRKIVAALHSGRSAEDYRARLQADLDAAQATPPRQDTVTLSPEAQTRLARGEPPAAEPTIQPPSSGAPPEVAAAITAYRRAAG
jgi:hypothetical protein